VVVRTTVLDDHRVRIRHHAQIFSCVGWRSWRPSRMTQNKSDWHPVGKMLGEGGQSKVYLVRSPARAKQRQKDLEQFLSINPWTAVLPAGERPQRTTELLECVADFIRSDASIELGAMKEFKIRDDEQQAVQRLSQEVEILRQGRPGLPKLLDFNLAERWMVTEYFPRGTLEDNHDRYKGKSELALKAFRSLLKTVATLHEQGIVHRDIKPANVFVREDDELVLGDFGIVYLPDQPNRNTKTGESVGPHDYMPPWADHGGRLGEVKPSFDNYMLGKLLWCMVAGRLRLPREYFDRADYDLTKKFADDPSMYMVNQILKHTVVEHEVQCVPRAGTIDHVVTVQLGVIERGGQMLIDGVPRPCHVCGVGHYQRRDFPLSTPPIREGDSLGLSVWVGDGAQGTLRVFPYHCDRCGHLELFTLPTPPVPTGTTW
jgi:serine/threonine protein kinase